MEPKKITFGFMKTKKADKPVVNETRDYIECLEEKSIKIIGGETVEDVKPLVIPMKPNTLVTAERLREIAETVEKDIAEDLESKPQITTDPLAEKPHENETLDQMAVRELLQDAQKKVTVETAMLTVPVPEKMVLDGEKESTLDDYESVPIQDFGMAMLRGMGWTPNKDGSKYKQPELRPKGLGLGADKVVKDKQKKQASKGSQNNAEELSIVKNAFVKITSGKYSGYYGKVVSLDEDNGRVMVDITIKKETVSLSEFMMEPVPKTEFEKQSRIINQDSYEEYKNREKSQNKSSRQEPNEPSSSSKTTDPTDYKRDQKHEKYRESERKYQEEKQASNGRNRDKDRKTRDSSSEDRVRKSIKDSSSEERSRRRKKEKKKYSSNESLDSLSDDKKKKHKSRRKHSSDDDSDDYKKNRRRHKTPEGNRDIDKKRKGKKKKRDRDRSPNYKKHRK